MRRFDSPLSEAVERQLPRWARNRGPIDAHEIVRSLNQKRRRRAFLEVGDALLACIESGPIDCPEGGLTAFSAAPPSSDRDWLVAALYADRVLVNIPSFVPYSHFLPVDIARLIAETRYSQPTRRESGHTKNDRPTAELPSDLDALLDDIDQQIDSEQTGRLKMTDGLISSVTAEMMRLASKLAPLVTTGTVTLVDMRHGLDDRQVVKSVLDSDPFQLDASFRARYRSLPLLEDVALESGVDLSEWVAAIGACLVQPMVSPRSVSTVTSSDGARRASQLIYQLVESVVDTGSRYDVRRKLPHNSGAPTPEVGGTVDRMETIPLFEELSLGAVPDTNRLSGLAIARLVDTKRLFLWQKEIRDAITSIRQAETVDEFRDEVRRQSTDLRSRFEAVERSLAAERHKGLMKTVFTATGGAVGAGVGLTHLNPLLIIAGAAAGAGLADRMVRAVDRDDKSVDSAIRPIVVEMNR